MTARQASLAALKATKEEQAIEVEESKIEELRTEALKVGKEEGKREALTEMMTAKHEQEVNDQARQAARAAAEPKRGRGRPKKAPEMRASTSMAAHTSPSSGWTAKGRRNKRKCLAMHARLAGRLQAAPLLPTEDTDEAWATYINDLSEILGESAAEMNVKALFISTLDAYDKHAQMGGRLNPLGWDTRGLVQFATTEDEWKVFDEDLVELSILYQEWFSSGPFIRLAGNTVKLLTKVNAYHVQNQAATQSQQPTAEEQSKYENL